MLANIAILDRLDILGKPAKPESSYTFVSCGLFCTSRAALLTESLKNTVFDTTELEVGKGHACIMYDTKLAGEASSMPHLRGPPFQQARLRKMVSAISHCRGDETGLQAGDLFCILDSGRTGNKPAFLASFQNPDGKAMEKVDTTYFITYDENSVAQRRGLTRGAATLQQVECMHVVSSEPIKLEKRNRKHFPFASNFGNMIGPISLPPLSEMWQVKAADKCLFVCYFGFVLGCVFD